MEKKEQNKMINLILTLITQTFIFILLVILVVAIYLGFLHVLDDVATSLTGNQLWFINFIKNISKFIIGLIILFWTFIFMNYQFSFAINSISKDTKKKEG